MKWILGVSFMAVVAAVAVTMTVPAQAVTPDEAILKLFPRETDGVAFFDVAALRSAPLYDEIVATQFKSKLPADVVEFGEATGFVLDRDLQQVTVARLGARQMVAVAPANYDRFKVEQYFNDKQVQSETYLGRVIFHPRSQGGISFLDNLVIVGHNDAVKKVIDRMAAPAENVLQNPEIMAAIQSIEAGNQVWAAGEFDSRLFPIQNAAPAQALELLKALKSGTYQMRVDTGIHVVATGQFLDSENARTTTDLLRGFVALAKLQAARQPDLLELLDGVQVEQSGLSMTVNFAADGDLLKRLQTLRKQAAE
jgi:hypothetical protein